MDTVIKTIHVESAAIRAPKKTGGALVSALAFVCLSWGVLAPILGVVFIIIHSTVESDQTFGEIGTGLMVVSIPLLLAGSHFLDMWDKHRKASEYPEKND
jgi:hypothetical protein